MPANFKVTPEQIVIVWGFAGPFLKKRAAASQPLWDDRVLQLADVVFANQTALYWFCQVINREAPPQAFQENAPADLKQECRAFAGNLEFVEGYLRDFGVAINEAPYVNAPEGHLEGLASAVAAKEYHAEADSIRGGAYTVDNQAPAPILGTPVVADPVAVEAVAAVEAAPATATGFPEGYTQPAEPAIVADAPIAVE